MENSKKYVDSTEAGFKNLLDVHTHALEENSEKVIEILERLKESKLDEKNKRALKRIKSELRGIDRKIDTLGRAEEVKTPKPRLSKEKRKKIEEKKKIEGDDWFVF